MNKDLISRKALLEEFQKTITEQSDTYDWLNMINKQPIAYNVDNVLTELKTSADLPLFETGILGIDINKAIYIIMNGGVTEN